MGNTEVRRKRRGQGGEVGPEKGDCGRASPPASFGYDSPRLQVENRTEHP